MMRIRLNLLRFLATQQFPPILHLDRGNLAPLFPVEQGMPHMAEKTIPFYPSSGPSAQIADRASVGMKACDPSITQPELEREAGKTDAG